MAGARAAASEYPPIGDYALIGDTRTTALVSRAGAIEWLCLPDVHDAALFAQILDRLNGGCLELRPTEPASVTRRYRPGTPILETRFETAAGVFQVTDCLCLFPDGLTGPLQPERELIRAVDALEGEPELALLYRPRPGFGERAPRLRRRGQLGWTFRAGADFHLFRTDLAIDKEERGALSGATRMKAGERRHVSLSFCRRDIGTVPRLGEEADGKIETTAAWWRHWSGRCRYAGPFADAVTQSLIALRQLSFSQSGAVVAAATTSLPEAIGGKRNWDYRFCWPRDAYHTLAGFMALGYEDEAANYFDWLMHATQLTAPEMRVLYDVYGRSPGAERELGALEGYRRSAPARVGNGAESQVQLDVYGSVIMAALAYVRCGGQLGAAAARRLTGLGEVVRRQWTRPDSGIWEMRGPPRHHSFSKLMCWAALDGLLTLHTRGMVDCDAAAFKAEREAIRAAIESRGWSERRRAYVGAFGEDFLDASLLLMPKLGFADARHPRVAATFQRIEEELTQGAFVWRYAGGIDGFEEREGSFLACGFWAAEHLALRGEPARARKRMEALLGAASDLGLLSEEFDPASGLMLGNFPQAFSHAALISAALAIQRCEQGQG